MTGDCDSEVRCYAGVSYPERPIAFRSRGGRWLEVSVIRSQRRTPEGMIYSVESTDGRRYRLIWSAAADTWQVSEELHD